MAIGTGLTVPLDITPELRNRVVKEAIEWIGTPFHHEARVKGAGVDCLQILAAVYHAAGIVSHIDVPHYPMDWMIHRDEERYLNGVKLYADEVPGPPERMPLPGDIVIMKLGRTFSHGAIVIEWPRLIHAYYSAGQVIYGSADTVPFSRRPLRFFNPFAKIEAA